MAQPNDTTQPQMADDEHKTAFDDDGKADALEGTGGLSESSVESRAQDKSATSSRPILLSFAPNDPEDPWNWRSSRKVVVFAIASNALLNGTMGSSLTSGSATAVEKYFHVDTAYNPWHVLPTSIYLVGYLIANPIWASLGEQYGRRPVLGISFFGVVVWTMACALSPTWAGFIVFRFLEGFFAGSAEANIGGFCADLYGHRNTRGRAVTAYNVFSQWGRVLGPIVSGFATTLHGDWRWTFWFGLIYAGLSWGTILVMPEVRRSVILAKRAKRMRKNAGPSSPDRNVYGPKEMAHGNAWQTLRVVLIRPLRMFCVEPIVFATCIYLAFQYGLFYIFFQSYSTIYEDLYGFNEGEKGLAFIAIGVGVLLAVPVQILYERMYHRAVEQGKRWAYHHGAHRLPVAMVAGPLIAISLFWSAWTARKSINWIAPVLAGIPFGLGYTMLFLSLLNYLVDAYPEYAASAVAATTFIHGIFGVALPFAASPMYASLGIGWAGSTLGFIAAALAVIPFAFWRYGQALLERSSFAMELAREATLSDTESATLEIQEKRRRSDV